MIPKSDEVLKLVSEYLIKNYDSDQFFLYGSYVNLVLNNHIITPSDIDVTVIDSPVQFVEKQRTVYIKGISLPVEITSMTTNEVIHEIDQLEPKYMSVLFDYNLSLQISQQFGMSWYYASASQKRSAISSISSKAYNKGKKKLTVLDDIDVDLGLKNIYHSFKFVMQCIANEQVNSFIMGEFYSSKLVNDLYEIRKLIYDTYYNSTGSYDERWKTLDSVTKPLYNAYMTEFRKHFPKELR